MAVAESIGQQADSFIHSPHKLLIDGQWVAAASGKTAGVFTRDISKAHKTAKRLRAGTVWINTYHVFDAAMPFGGYKESGWGREMGSQVLNNYLETKSVVTAL
jgi:acyl-CoA reductase-like NAD-dependent aldehyde dehydrogenase